MTHPPDATDPSQGILMGQRRRLINVACRILGSMADAEDAVQDAFAQWYALSASQQIAIQSVPAWLTTVVSRVCLDQLGSARAQREKYVGQWLPEPVPHVGRTPAACRQLASAARRRVQSARPVQSPAAQRAAAVRSFKRAWEAKDIGALVSLLDPAASVVADGGGNALASPDPIAGGDEIARYLVSLAEQAGTVQLLERTVNGRPGLIAIDAGSTTAVYAFELSGVRIWRIWVVRNPDKLRLWTET